MVTYDHGGILVVGGEFTRAGSAAASNIALWDGTSWSALGEGLNGRVEAITVWNGDIYAGGYLTASGGTTLSHLARWTGTDWVDVAAAEPTAESNALTRFQCGTPGGWGPDNLGSGQVAAQGVARWDAPPGQGWAPISGETLPSAIFRSFKATCTWGAISPTATDRSLPI